jgi:tetratricopeptide (TPR) repeat protein
VQVVFALMAALLVCSLITGALGTVVIDAVSNDDGSADLDNTAMDASIERSFRATAEADEDNASAAAALANYLANTGKLTEAIEWYEKAIQIAPADASIRLDFARSLADGGFAADAELQFRESIRLNPGDSQTHFYLAEMYANSSPQKTAEAISEYERTIETGPDTFVAQRARERLDELGITTGTPSPSA